MGAAASTVAPSSESAAVRLDTALGKNRKAVGRGKEQDAELASLHEDLKSTAAAMDEAIKLAHLQVGQAVHNPLREAVRAPPEAALVAGQTP